MLRFRVQHFVLPVVGGRASEKLFKKFIKVACVVKANGDGKVCDRAKIFLGVHQFFCGFIDAVLHQILKRTHLQGSGKTTAALAFADVNAVGNLLQCQWLGVVCPNKQHRFFDAMLVLRCAKDSGSVCLGKLTEHLHPKMAKMSLGGDFIAEILAQV